MTNNLTNNMLNDESNNTIDKVIGKVINVSIQTHKFSLAQEEKMAAKLTQNCGALVAFQGLVRGKDHQEPLFALYLEHYPQITAKAIEKIAHAALLRWPFEYCRIIHRIGTLKVNAPIVLVLICATHRQDAFNASQFIMDYLKTEAPFWKKEIFASAPKMPKKTRWVTQNNTDQIAKQKWELPDAPFSH